MPRFNFINITSNSRAKISDVMDNFNLIEQYGITAAEVTNAISASATSINNSVDDKLSNYTTTANLGGLALKNYSYGTSEPTGGSNGDIYDQYF